MKSNNDFHLTVDVVLFTLQNQALSILLEKRKNLPFAQHWAIPTCDIDLQHDDSLEQAAKRQLKQLTGLEAFFLEQVQTLGDSQRDPRGWSVTIVYYSLVPYCQVAHCQWVSIKEALTYPLAFDHQEIIKKCLQRFQSKSLYTSLPIFLLPAEFTLTELQKAYEAVLEFPMEKKSFRRRLLDAGFLEETGNVRRAKNRPAHLYRLSKLQPYFFPRILEGARS